MTNKQNYDHQVVVNHNNSIFFSKEEKNVALSTIFFIIKVTRKRGNYGQKSDL